jgi:hypothetical protein
MLERQGFNYAAVTYLTGICDIASLDDIAYLDGIDDLDTMIKDFTNQGGIVKTGT